MTKSRAVGLRCIHCKAEYPLGKFFEGCEKCRTSDFISCLSVEYEYDKIRCETDGITKSKEGGVWKYSELLPAEDKFRISLNEGNTPLIMARRFGEKIGLRNLYIKDESRNPTWSFKDRLCSVGVSMGLQFHAKATTLSSSGNHGIAAAAYSSRAGLPCVIFTHALTNHVFLTLMQKLGGTIVPVRTPLDRWRLMESCVKKLDLFPLSSFTQPMPTANPYGVEGAKTIAFELVEQLGKSTIDKVIWPLGLGDGFFALWKGFKELQTLGIIEQVPQMIAVEVASGGPVNNALKKNLTYIETVDSPKSAAVSIATTTSINGALTAIRESKGMSVLVSDNEMFEAQKLLANLEGIYGEFSSCATIAGLRKLIPEVVERDDTVVCVLTSSGMKDGPSIINLEPIDGSWESLLSHIPISIRE